MSTLTTDTRLRELIDGEIAELIEIRHDLHAHPELGYDEHRTAGIVVDQLERAGVSLAKDLAGGTGVLGHLPGGQGPAVGLRADMDALPIEERTALPYCSQHPGRMHACGHDGHTTILIGAARILAKIAGERTLPRPVTFIFQPAEEGGAGGERMVQDGCLDGSVLGPPVANMFGLHGWPRYPLNVVGTRPGPIMAAADEFDLVVRGKGAHAAFPHASRDPIVAASAIVGALQSIVARNIDPLEPVVISLTRFHAGTAHNIIPDEVDMSGTVRSLSPDTRDLARRRLQEVIDGVASAHGCTAEIRYQPGYPLTINAPEAVEIFNRVAREAFGADRVKNVENPVMGAEDFSYYAQKIPSCFFVLGLDPGRGDMPDLHQPTFDFNDDAIATGVEAFCRIALRD